MTKKIISYSLWGDKPAYYYGMLENILKRDEIYPNWIIRIYYGEGALIEKFIPIYQKFKDVECINMIDFNKNNWGNNFTSRNMMWRFLPCFEDKKNVEIVIIRDNDSVFTRREANAVNDWLKSNKKYHIMKDNKVHRGEILGGMWGFKNDNSLIPYKEKMIKYPAFEKNKGVDMFFLRDVVYPLASKSAYVSIGNDGLTKLKNNKFVKVTIFSPYRCKDFVGREITDAPLTFKYLNEEPFYLTKKPWRQPFKKNKKI